MFKQLFYTLVAIFAISPLATMAQEQTFTGTPLVREGSEWCFYSQVHTLSGSKYIYYYQYIKGDTILNGIPYKKLYEECTCEGAEKNIYVNQTVAFIREENGRVSVVQDTTTRNISCGRSVIRMKVVKGDYFDLNTEYVLYDFNDIDKFMNDFNQVMNRLQPDNPIYHFYAEPTEIENVLVPGRKCYKVKHDFINGGTSERGTYIEGIGFYANVYEHNYRGDVISFQYLGVTCPPRPILVYMKNPNGEFEFLDEEYLPSGIDLLKHSDMKVAAADGHISVSLPDYVQSGMLEVIDLNGRVVATQMMFGNHADVYLKHYAKGMYIVQFRAEGHLAVQKIIL